MQGHSMAKQRGGVQERGAVQQQVNHNRLLNQLLLPHLPDWTVDRWVGLSVLVGVCCWLGVLLV
jgi:hypothetical protein